MRGGLVAVAVVATLGAGVASVSAVRAGEATPGTTVAGVDVGGLDRAGLRDRLGQLARERAQGELVVTAGHVRGAVPRAVVAVDVEETVDAVLDAGGFLDALLGRGEPVEPAVDVDITGLSDRISTLAAEVDREPAPGGFAVAGTEVQPLPPVEGRTLEQQEAVDAVVEALEARRQEPLPLPVTAQAPPTTPAQVEAVVGRARAALAGPYVLGGGDAALRVMPQEVAPLLSAGPELELEVDVPALHEVVHAKAEPLSRPARSAGFEVGGRPAAVDTQGDLAWTPRPATVRVRPGTTGREVDVDAATARVAELVLAGRQDLERELPFTTVDPPLTTQQAEAAGVRDLIGTFTTYFQAGQPRATNIRRIAELVDRTYVAPGEVFSLNGEAGRRTEARGFVADGAIVDGELTDEVGGGVSQFATTLFNAAFFAGLPILEHKPHSFYISRYPAGRESTVYFGAIDVKFRNDTGHGVWVGTRSTAGSVTVELYGDNGGRRVTSTAGERVPSEDGGFTLRVTRSIAGGDGRGERRVFTTRYDPVPTDE